MKSQIASEKIAEVHFLINENDQALTMARDTLASLANSESVFLYRAHSVTLHDIEVMERYRAIVSECAYKSTSGAVAVQRFTVDLYHYSPLLGCPSVEALASELADSCNLFGNWIYTFKSYADAIQALALAFEKITKNT